jgi:hypothetical protein
MCFSGNYFWIQKYNKTPYLISWKLVQTEKRKEAKRAGVGLTRQSTCLASFEALSSNHSTAKNIYKEGRKGGRDRRRSKGRDGWMGWEGRRLKG